MLLEDWRIGLWLGLGLGLAAMERKQTRLHAGSFGH
jgi:hypothetical protein